MNCESAFRRALNASGAGVAAAGVGSQPRHTPGTQRRRPSPLMGEGSLPALMVLTRPPPPAGSPWHHTLLKQQAEAKASAGTTTMEQQGGNREAATAAAAEAWRRSQVDPGLLGWRSPSPRLAGSPPIATSAQGVGRVKHHLSHRGVPSLEHLKESMFLVQVRCHDGVHYY